MLHLVSGSPEWMSDNRICYCTNSEAVRTDRVATCLGNGSFPPDTRLSPREGHLGALGRSLSNLRLLSRPDLHVYIVYLLYIYSTVLLRQYSDRGDACSSCAPVGHVPTAIMMNVAAQFWGVRSAVMATISRDLCGF